MKKVILVIISIVLVMIPGCTLNECKKEKMIYKSKEEKAEPYLYNSAIKSFMFRKVIVLNFETNDEKTIEFEINTTNQQYSNLKVGEEYVVEYNSNEIISVDDRYIKEDKK